MKTDRRLCLVCNQLIGYNKLKNHLKSQHEMTQEQYKDKYNLRKYCACGCGIEIKENLKWAHGHHSRVNNISKREDVRLMRQQKMQEWHDSGNWVPWNKGISDERTLRNGQAANATKLANPDFLANQSKVMKDYWQQGKIVKLSGSKSSRWKGGTSSLTQALRSDYNLYKFWKYPILIRDSFKCINCQSIKKLTIHHDVEKMCDIIAKFIPQDKHELSYEEKKVIINKIVEYHVENKVSGITLCKECHKKLHNSYNI